VTQAKPKVGRVVSPELRTEFEQIATASGCELVQAEIKGNILRIVLDRPEGGVTLADCQHVSKQVSALLDVADFGSSRYVLEVSSPGLDRELYGPRDYARFVGKLVRVTIQEPETRTKRTVVARLEEYRPGGPGEPGGDGDGASDASNAKNEDPAVVLLDDNTGERTLVSLKNIPQARL
jgi:ribosome maturation factor RimP